jgi:hypothetical protein
VKWEKDHGRLCSWRIARKAVTPEEIGLCGCWQILAVERHREELCGKTPSQSCEVSYYVSSLQDRQRTNVELLGLVRDHFGSIENGSHHRRDVTYREDGSRIAKSASRWRRCATWPSASMSCKKPPARPKSSLAPGRAG